jgi:hypothetical protein
MKTDHDGAAGATAHGCAVQSMTERTMLNIVPTSDDEKLIIRAKLIAGLSKTHFDAYHVFDEAKGNGADLETRRCLARTVISALRNFRSTLSYVCGTLARSDASRLAKLEAFAGLLRIYDDAPLDDAEQWQGAFADLSRSIVIDLLVLHGMIPGVLPGSDCMAQPLEASAA